MNKINTIKMAVNSTLGNQQIVDGLIIDAENFSEMIYLIVSGLKNYNIKLIIVFLKRLYNSGYFNKINSNDSYFKMIMDEFRELSKKFDDKYYLFQLKRHIDILNLGQENVYSSTIRIGYNDYCILIALLIAEGGFIEYQYILDNYDTICEMIINCNDDLLFEIFSIEFKNFYDNRSTSQKKVLDIATNNFYKTIG